jgi:hypothetical protein
MPAVGSVSGSASYGSLYQIGSASVSASNSATASGSVYGSASGSAKYGE